MVMGKDTFYCSNVTGFSRENWKYAQAPSSERTILFRIGHGVVGVPMTVGWNEP